MVRVARRFHSAAKAAGLPPAGRLVTIKVTRVQPPKTAGWPGQVHGPRKVGAKDWEILVRLPNDQLDQLVPHVHRLRHGGKARITVE